jgi:hypothetical protein
MEVSDEKADPADGPLVPSDSDESSAEEPIMSWFVLKGVDHPLSHDSCLPYDRIGGIARPKGWIATFETEKEAQSFIDDQAKDFWVVKLVSGGIQIMWKHDPGLHRTLSKLRNYNSEAECMAYIDGLGDKQLEWVRHVTKTGPTFEYKRVPLVGERCKSCNKPKKDCDAEFEAMDEHNNLGCCEFGPDCDGTRCRG